MNKDETDAMVKLNAKLNAEFEEAAIQRQKFIDDMQMTKEKTGYEMNERIRELAERADFFLESNNEIRKLEKFAELLLDEFIEALEESNGTHSETSEYGLSILIGDIRKHFGMEEIT